MGRAHTSAGAPVVGAPVQKLFANGLRVGRARRPGRLLLIYAAS